MRTMMSLLALLLALPATAAERPEPLSLAMGMGIEAPKNILGINYAVARLLVAPRFFLEPHLGFTSSSKNDVAENNAGKFETKTTSSTITVGTGARYAFASRGDVDLDGLVDFAVDIGNTKVNPEGTGNDTTAKLTAIGLRWGLGLEYWASDHISITADGLNPLVRLTNSSTEDAVSETTVTSKASEVGVIFDPTVRFAVNLHF